MVGIHPKENKDCGLFVFCFFFLGGGGGREGEGGSPPSKNLFNSFTP